MNILGAIFGKKKEAVETIFYLCKQCDHLYASSLCTNCDGCSCRTECIGELNSYNIERDGVCFCCRAKNAEKKTLLAA